MNDHELPSGGPAPDSSDAVARALADTRAAMDARSTPDFAASVRARLEEDTHRPAARARIGFTSKAFRGAFVA